MSFCEHRDQFRSRSGFTLVEMMVVIAIMAGLATVATVSIGTTQDRARADKTALIGRQVVEDLERSDNLSFVSDLGRLPRTADEVKFLFSRNLVDSAGSALEAADHRFQVLQLPAALPSGAPAGSAVKLANTFGSPELGVGWRGPYNRVTELREKDGRPSGFLDGWKNEWDVILGDGSFSGVRSLGRDAAEGGLEWQDSDLEFSLRRTPENVDLQGQVIVKFADGVEYTTKEQFSDLTLRIVYFAPEFDLNFPANQSTGNVAAVEFTWDGTTWSNPARSEQAAANPFLFRLSGLTAGHRAIFIYGFGTPVSGIDTGLFGGGVRLIHLQPGANKIEFRLTEL